MNRFLLDTHTFIWMAAKEAKLSSRVRKIVANRSNELLLSGACGWETAILWKLKKISLPDEPQRFLPEAAFRLGITPLPIGFGTAIASALLPCIHRDPFDRLIIAEARQQDIPVLSKDKVFDKYEIEVIW